MRKSVTKIVKATVAFAMAIGAGVGAGITGNKNAERLDAAIVNTSGTDTINTTGFGGYTTNSFSAQGTDRTGVANGTNTTGVTYALQVFNGSTGAVRGNQTGWGNFSARNTTTQTGFYISKVKLTVSGGTIDGSTSGRSRVYFGSSMYSASGTPGGTETAPSPASSGQSSLEWTNSNTLATYFVLYALKTSGTATNGILEVTWASSGGGDPVTYTSVEVSQKTALTGTYKGDAYYECQASVSGTGAYSSAVTWSITSTNAYGTGKTIANVATIDDNGKIIFLDNVNPIYVWATAADESTHNATGFAVVASGLLVNPINSWIKITDVNDVSVNKVYALSNDKTYFAGKAVASNAIALETSLNAIGYVVLESAASGYYVRFASCNNDVWTASGNYIKWANDSTKLSSTISKDSTYGTWNVVANGDNGVYLKNVSSSRHLGLNGTTDIRAYASGNLVGNAPVYLWEAGSLPVINCDTIELTGKPSESMSIGDTATLGYYALGTDSNEWTGDVVYSISNESTNGVVELSATSGVSVTLTAKKAGTARVSVRDKDENADADYVDITVLADPERTELPVANYNVEISYSGVKSGDEVPASKSYEIKAKEGVGAGRIWYKNMTIAYSNVTANYANEYTFSKNGNASTATITTTSEVAKVTEVVISYYNGNRLTLTDASSNEIDVASSSNNICTYNLNSSSFTLSSTSTTTSIYSIQITFTVVNENEEFLSLVISKGVTASSFVEGDAPNATGLTVHENYSTDGSSISRYEDVTASVTWDYSIETIGANTTSYTVTATYGGHTSAPVTIDGFTVTPVAKYSLFESSIVEGDYIIYYDGAALNNTILENRAQYEEVSPVNDKILTNDATIIWHIAPADETYFTIYNADADQYLASTGAKSKAQLLDDGTDDKALWTIQMSAGKFEFVNKQNTTNGVNANLRKNGTYGFACYADGTGGKLSLYRATIDTYLKSASAVATYTEDANGNILRLGSSISVEKWNSIVAVGEITDYGVMIYKTDSEAKITSKTPVEDAYRAGVVQPAIARKGNGTAPSPTDEAYVFTARVKVSNPNTIFCSASFVVVGGQYYFFNEQHISASQLAA